MAKAIRKKKYNPDGSVALFKRAWLRTVWITDTSLQEGHVVRTGTKKDFLNFSKFPSEATMKKWLAELRTTPYMWRITFLGFDLEKEEVYPSVIEVTSPMSSKSATETIKTELKKFLNENIGMIDSWGYIATPSQDVAIDISEETYIDYFVEAGLTDDSKFQTRANLREQQLISKEEGK